MSDGNMVFVHTQRDFQRALKREPEGAVVVLNADRTYVVPVVQRSTPFPEVIVRGEATLIGGRHPLRVTVLDGGEVSVENVAFVRADTNRCVNVADTPGVTILAASTASVRNCETVVVNKGISLAAYGCDQVIIEEKSNETDA